MATEPNPFDAYHDAPLTYDAQGIPTADVPFTPKADTKRYAVIVPPSRVIPVVFLPGIMGSNLRLKELPPGFENKRYTTTRGFAGWGDRAWRPDDAVDFMAQRFWPLEAGDRRALLDPNNTLLDERGDIPPQVLEGFVFDSPADGRNQEAQGKLRRDGFANEMKRRGWGSVFLTSYGPLLAYLERNLNQMFHRGDLTWFWQTNIIDRLDRGWGIARGDKPVTRGDVKKAARYWLPVHALGYNWIRSIRDNATDAVTRLQGFIDHYKRMQYQCEQVILVTHSMGGLLARAVVHPAMGGFGAKVLGVVHGVMPTHGAAAAYRRCRAGFEGSEIAARVLGRDGPEVAAVFSNSPGALQLLPSKLYGRDWLRAVDDKGKAMLSLPKADPYTEIYQERKAWWRLMNPEWVNPVKNAKPSDVKGAWNAYLRNLDEAADFHETLSAAHHQHTFVQYGCDQTNFAAFGTITWNFSGGGELMGNPLTSTRFIDDPRGMVTLQDVLSPTAYMPRFKLSDRRDEAGDGTVPIRSAKGLDKTVELVAAQGGYDHQNSYGDRRTQELTVYSVARLVADYAPD